MRALLRWLVLAPICLGLLCLFLAATVAAHYLVEQHLCPAADFDRGICNNQGMQWALGLILHASMACGVAAIGAMAAIVAPSHKRQAMGTALALLVLAAAWFGYAGSEGTLFIAALVGAGVGGWAITAYALAPAETSTTDPAT